ncbi:hypothetical protein SAMN05421812_105470 [Asanoa hainanensis]|uniref:Gram-positive cocci surface proteins LPxTG domain-containing protein n=1 Tax=Asanoa hainanensis TaxID=560556 RepID=A0A239MJ20_9ACTN|nr:hypothetical protein [Asanoa hainanensis]SNT41958.1 hypothetical protein SAMN05421812_105470 [Asanoa hainanensis]
MSVVSFAALGRIVVAGAAAAAGTVLIVGLPAHAEPPSPATPAAPAYGEQPGGGEPGGGQAEGTWIEVSPSTVQAGEQVQIKASCKEKVDEAKAHSKAFGEVVLVPKWGFLTGEATVPADTRKGDYEVKLTCVKSGHAETKLKVIERSRPSHGPHTGGGGLAGSGGDGTVALVSGLATVTAGAGLALALRRRRRLV